MGRPRHPKEHSVSCMQESAVWVGKSRALKATGVNSHLSLIKFWTLVKLYWHRQLGTALSWFVCSLKNVMAVAKVIKLTKLECSVTGAGNKQKCNAD